MSDMLIAAIAEQERRLVLDHFDEDIAFALGCAIRERAQADAAPVSIEIRTAARRLFFAARPGASPDNEEWGRRKGNVVLRTFKSSMRAALESELSGRAQWPDLGMPHSDFVFAGGGFPVALKGLGVIGAIAISGLPSIRDHELATATLADYLGLDGIALPDTA